jgi:hypothetical protein
MQAFFNCDEKNGTDGSLWSLFKAVDDERSRIEDVLLKRYDNIRKGYSDLLSSTNIVLSEEHEKKVNDNLLLADDCGEQYIKRRELRFLSESVSCVEDCLIMLQDEVEVVSKSEPNISIVEDVPMLKKESSLEREIDARIYVVLSSPIARENFRVAGKYKHVDYKSIRSLRLREERRCNRSDFINHKRIKTRSEYALQLSND